GGDPGGGQGDHPAGRLGARPRRGRRGRRRRRHDGVHQPPALQALTPDLVSRLGGDPASPWEDRYGFSRVLRVGGFVLIGGTTSVDRDGVVAGASPYEQTVEILR